MSAIIIILLIANVLNQFTDNVWVGHAFAGIRVAVCALVLNSIVKLWKSGVKNKWGILLFLIAFVLVAFVNVNTVWLVIGGIIAGLLYQVLGEKRALHSDKEGKER